MNIFDEKNIDLFHPEGVEYLYSILQNIGFTEFKSKEARTKGLDIIKNLFGLGLVEIFHWGNQHKVLEGKDLSNKEIMEEIEKIWFVGSDFSDFFGMPMLKYRDWYIEALRDNGFQMRGVNWKTFVSEKIGDMADLRNWIEQNRPKE